MAHAAILKFVTDMKLQSMLIVAPTGGGEDAASTFADLLNNNPPAGKAAAGPAPVSTPAARIAKAESPAFDESPFPAEKESAATPDFDPDDVELSDPKSFASTVENPVTAPSANLAAGAGPELTIVIDDKTPGSQKRVIVIPKASAWMMELLTGESTDGTPSSMTAALRPAIPTATNRVRSQYSKRATERVP
jgi:hypothetical protein